MPPRSTENCPGQELFCAAAVPEPFTMVSSTYTLSHRPKPLHPRDNGTGTAFVYSGVNTSVQMVPYFRSLTAASAGRSLIALKKLHPACDLHRRVLSNPQTLKGVLPCSPELLR